MTDNDNLYVCEYFIQVVAADQLIEAEWRKYASVN